MRELQSLDAIATATVDGADQTPPAGGVPVPPRIAESAQRLAAGTGEDLESILYYEHPFTARGLLVVVSDRAQPFLQLLASIHQALHLAAKVHCLRRRELFQLALPGCGPAPLDDQPHLAHCVKYRSSLLHGRDCRPEVPLPMDPSLFLRAHVRDYRWHLRVHFLRLLVAGEKRKLLEEAVVEARRIMSTALMGDGGWRVDLADVTQRFAERRCDEACKVARRLETLAAQLASGSGGGLDESAAEAFWLLERLVRLLAKGVL